jgi:hypothetical protein
MAEPGRRCGCRQVRPDEDALITMLQRTGSAPVQEDLLLLSWQSRLADAIYEKKCQGPFLTGQMVPDTFPVDSDFERKDWPT